MTNVQFRQCANCNLLRSWSKEVCPECDDDSFNTVTQSGTGLIEDSIGDSVSESTLFASNITQRNIRKSENKDQTSGLIPDRLRGVVGSRLPDMSGSLDLSVQIEYRLCNYLEPNEQPEFILFFGRPLREDNGTEVRTIEHSSDNTHIQSELISQIGGLLLVTDSRLLILVEQEQHTITRSIEYADVKKIENAYVVDRGGFDKLLAEMGSKAIYIREESHAYQLLECTRIKEVSPVVAYVSAQISGEEFDAESVYTDSETVGERMKSVISQIDFKQVVSYSATGGKCGSRGGPKGAAVGAVIGAAYAIYSSVTSKSPKDAGEPDADSIGSAAAEWRQAGAEMDDKRAEWLGASLGAATQIAAEQSDRDTISSVQHLDPQTTTQIIQRGLEAVDSQSNLPATPEEFDYNLPESVQTWQSVTADLLEQGLLDELQATHKKYTDGKSA